MKTLLFCVVLAALPAHSERREAYPVPIALYTHFQHEPPPAVFDALQDEVNSIMAPMDLHFSWHSQSAAHSGVVSVVAVVITFKSACDVFGLTPHSSNPGPLGWTHISDGVILPFAGVDCQAIRAFIQKRSSLFRPKAAKKPTAVPSAASSRMNSTISSPTPRGTAPTESQNPNSPPRSCCPLSSSSKGASLLRSEPARPTRRSNGPRSEGNP